MHRPFVEVPSLCLLIILSFNDALVNVIQIPVELTIPVIFDLNRMCVDHLIDNVFLKEVDGLFSLLEIVAPEIGVSDWTVLLRGV